MQCPKCGYEPTLAETQRSPDDCVKCGINYAGHARHAAEQAQRKKEGAATIKLAPAVRVVVIDINMSFWSMVKFMVKFAFATIPAALIVTFVVSAAISAYSSYQLYTRVSQVKPTAETQRQSLAPDQIYVPLPVSERFYEISRHTEDGLTVITVRTQLADGSSTYSKLQVDCSNAVARIIARGNGIGELIASRDVEQFARVVDGTPRKFIAKRACSEAPQIDPILQ
ncbi:hypothetical protein [Metapseudomonas otitidis]|uniref:hypothetical protein n=1 Tax=Metapseudomonas otitidis TaxID=319939 RepID=UPI0028123B7A|nr:hypothetical protein [Pseudomonas otitidis]WMR30535.1 hypothetical protein QT513_15050 [Pseudomonas otitidis]